MTEEKKPKRVKGDCPDCGKNRWAQVLGEKRTQWDDDEAPVSGSDIYRLLECAGCERVYYQHLSYFSEDLDYKKSGEAVLVPKEAYFPSLSKRERPDWLWHLLAWSEDNDLGELFVSLYTAIDHDLVVLAASGVRMVFDFALTKLGIDPALTFEAKIDELKAQGRIGQYEQEDITAMVDAASAAMHRGWKPSLEELDTMMTTLERFIHHSFTLKGKAAKLKEKVPPKQSRKKSSE